MEEENGSNQNQNGQTKKPESQKMNLDMKDEVRKFLRIKNRAEQAKLERGVVEKGKSEPAGPVYTPKQQAKIDAINKDYEARKEAISKTKSIIETLTVNH